MAITTAAQAISEINATNLTDGQQIKTLLADLSTWIGTISAEAGGVTPQPPVTALTDSSGGTSGGNTIAAIAATVLTVTSALTGADTATLPLTSSVNTALATLNTSLTELRNAVSTLAAKQNAVISTLVTSGLMT